LANDGVIDAVSVGVTPTKFSYDEEGVMIVEAATWQELSLVSEGAFSGAVITEVAASAPDEVAEGIPETELTSAIQSEQQEQKDTTPMSETPVTPVVEAAQATVEKLWAQPAREFKMPTPGEYFAAMHIGGDTFAKRFTRILTSSQVKAISVASSSRRHCTTDTPGLLPVPVLGPCQTTVHISRPELLLRPVVIQDVDFTDPASLNIILNDLVGQYMLASDNVAADAITAGATASGSTWTVFKHRPVIIV
jgi:hypothetical protein